MADKEWIRHLANATWSEGKWEHAEPESVRKLMQSRIEDATFQILQEAQDAAEMFNLYSKSDLKIKILPLGQSVHKVTGAVFMLGSLHASLQLYNDMLDFVLTRTQEFQKVTLKNYRIYPQVDPFGTVVWQADQAPLMDYTMLVKRVFEELLRQAHECGELAKPKTDSFVTSSIKGRKGK